MILKTHHFSEFITIFEIAKALIISNEGFFVVKSASVLAKTLLPLQTDSSI